jgi:hypothetical protein
MSQPDARVTILPPIALSPRAARDFTYDALAGWRLTSSAREETILVVDELVAHAIKRASGPIIVVLSLSADAIHVEVTEESDIDLDEDAPSESRAGRGTAPSSGRPLAWLGYSLPGARWRNCLGRCGRGERNAAARGPVVARR